MYILPARLSILLIVLHANQEISVCLEMCHVFRVHISANVLQLLHVHVFTLIKCLTDSLQRYC